MERVRAHLSTLQDPKDVDELGKYTFERMKYVFEWKKVHIANV